MKFLCFEIKYIGKSYALRKEVEASLKNKGYIPSIKRHRELTGSTLRDARDYVDEARMKLHPNEIFKGY